MKATLNKAACKNNARNYSGEKELIERWQVVAIDKTAPDGLRVVIDARAWTGKSKASTVVYASVWIHTPGEWMTGSGNAGGYGYHKKSAAIASALASAGVELWGSPYANPVNKETARQWKALEKKQRAYIGGCGDASIEAALKAIALSIGYKKTAIV